jgi:hypothetical protein
MAPMQQMGGGGEAPLPLAKPRPPAGRWRRPASRNTDGGSLPAQPPTRPVQ